MAEVIRRDDIMSAEYWEGHCKTDNCAWVAAAINLDDKQEEVLSQKREKEYEIFMLKALKYYNELMSNPVTEATVFPKGHVINPNDFSKGTVFRATFEIANFSQEVDEFTQGSSEFVVVRKNPMEQALVKIAHGMPMGYTTNPVKIGEVSHHRERVAAIEDGEIQSMEYDVCLQYSKFQILKSGGYKRKTSERDFSHQWSPKFV